MTDSDRRNHEGTPQEVAGSTAGASGAGDHGRLMTVSEIAQLAGCTKWAVYHALERHLPVAVWHPYRVHRGDVRRWMELRRLNGDD